MNIRNRDLSLLILCIVLIMSSVATVVSAKELSNKFNHQPVVRKGSDNVKPKRQLALYFPKGVTSENAKILADSVEWFSLNPDGTFPEEVAVPENVTIPEVLYIPAAEVQIPSINKDGKTEWHTETVPAATIELAKVLEAAAASKESPGLATRSTTYNAFSARVTPAFAGHCTWQNRALYTVPASSNLNNWVGHSTMPTWTSSNGSVEDWDFQRDTPTEAKLCIPKSLYWARVYPQEVQCAWNPVACVTAIWLMAGYNSSASWTMND